jgi:NAD(P)H-hydrate repair Nnr-like enzyme with NAD(P)H-hydrate dehydratase domain
VLTPHDGEFEGLRPGQLGGPAGRLAEVRSAAAELDAIVVLKGPGTVVASPDGTAFIDVEGTSDLATAGSGDVLTGLLAAVLAGAWAEGRRDEEGLTRAAAAAVWLHGRAGRHAARQGPVAATDIAAAVRSAVRAARFGEDS